MKSIKLLSLVLLIFVFQTVSANVFTDWKNQNQQTDDGNTHYGPTKIENQSLKDLTILGPAIIKNSTIQNTASFKGPVNASKSSFNNINIEGIAKFENVSVLGELVIKGPLYANDSSFNDITITSTELSLARSSVNKLVIQKSERRSAPKVYLDKGVVVGSIIFESGNGKVIVGDPSVVIKDLKGGEISKSDE